MNTFLYEWYDEELDLKYIGIHKGSFDDGYICSSKTMLREYKKRPNKFKRKILCIGKYEYIIKMETKLLQLVNAAPSKNYYNLTNGGGGFLRNGHVWNKGLPAWNRGLPQTQKQIERAKKHRHSPETKEKIKESRKKQVICHSDETKKKMSNSRIKWIEKNGISDETKQRMSISAKKGRSKKQIEIFKKMLSDNKDKIYNPIKCPHCGITGKIIKMKRWHFNYCKYKKEI